MAEDAKTYDYDIHIPMKVENKFDERAVQSALNEAHFTEQIRAIVFGGTVLPPEVRGRDKTKFVCEIGRVRLTAK